MWIKSPNADVGDVQGDPKQIVANRAGMLVRSGFVSVVNQMMLFGARLKKTNLKKNNIIIMNFSKNIKIIHQ